LSAAVALQSCRFSTLQMQYSTGKLFQEFAPGRIDKNAAT